MYPRLMTKMILSQMRNFTYKISILDSLDISFER